MTLPSSSNENVHNQLLSSASLNVPEDILFAAQAIQNSVSEVIAFKDIKFVLDYIQKVYAVRGGEIHPDIIALFSNLSFKKQVNEYIYIKTPKILNTDSNHAFEEISFYIYLLGIGNIEHILLDLNTYDFEKLDALFSYYIENILSNVNNTEKFENYFAGYINVFELSNRLSILNEVDSSRKVLIPGVVNIMDKNNTILFQALQEKGLLTKQRENILEHMNGRILFNFSHIHYIETKDRDLDSILIDFLSILNNQKAGYQKAFDSDFWNNLSRKSLNYHTFIWNMSYVINILGNKIAHFDEKEVLSNLHFQEILKVFLETFHIDPSTIQTLSDLSHMSNSILAGIYFEDDSKIWDLSWETWKETIRDFISSNDEKNDQQIECIHHLVMFLDNLTFDDYLEIGMYLVKTRKYNNYNFEFFKLKTLDIIISRIQHQKDNENIRILLTDVIIYIENNKTASQLLNTYSRLYLSVAYYYAESFNETYVNWGLEYFTRFFKMWGDVSDFPKYGKNIDDFYYNIGLYYLNTTLCGSICGPWDCDTLNPDCKFTKEQVILFGQKFVDLFKEKYEITLRTDLDRVISDLLDNALSKNEIADEEINNRISIVLSNSIFHGIAKSYIIDVHSDKEFVNDLVLHNGIHNFQIDLFNGYKLIFVFPKIYKDIFNKVYEREKTYILRNIKNIITSYLKRKDLYTDHNTGLPNEFKLKNILWTFSRVPAFILIKLNTLKSLNNGYSYNFWDQYLKSVVKQLLDIPEIDGKFFKLSWAKIAILLNNENNISDIILKIKEIRFSLGDSVHKLDSLIGVVENSQSRVLEKAQVAIAHAKNSTTWVVTYTSDLDNTEKDKILVEYISKLDKAIDENRVIPYYQPLFDAKTLMPYKYESLMRVVTPEGKVEGPFNYLESAKAFWRLVPVTNHIIEKVFQFATTNEAKYSINLSGEDLSNKDLLGYIDKMLGRYKINPSRITFEILEGEWESVNKNISTVKKLKTKGFKIALDDFWSNSSNINRLLDFLSSWLLDYLKIDAEIIKMLSGKNPKLTKEFQNLQKELEWLETKKQFFVWNRHTLQERNQIMMYYTISEQIKKLMEIYSDYSEILLWIKEKIKDIGNNRDIVNAQFDLLYAMIDEKAKSMQKVTKTLIGWFVAACHSVGVETVAEFVDSEIIQTQCQELGIDYLQWFYLWEPNGTLDVKKQNN